MKKVLLIVPYNSGTIARCSLNLWNALKERKEFDVKCVTVHNFKGGFKEFVNCDSCNEKEASPLMKWRNLFNQIIWLRRLKLSFKPDISISTLDSCSALNVLSGGRDFKIGIFHSPHIQAKAKGKLVYMSTLLFFRFVYSKLNRIICVSNHVKDSILNAFPRFDSNDMRVVYNVHDFDAIKKKAACTNVDHIDDIDNKTLIYVGRLDNNKSPDRAISAFAKALPDLPKDAKICFIGADSDNLLDGLHELAIEKGIADRVIFMGFKDNPYPYMKRSKALISTSYSEGLPGVMIESLYLGVPIVSTNSSKGIWEILSCSENYDENLQGIFESKDGIISSNLNNINDNKLYFKDIDNLALAIKRIFQEDNHISFNFFSKLDKNKIVNQIIN